MAQRMMFSPPPRALSFGRDEDWSWVDREATFDDWQFPPTPCPAQQQQCQSTVTNRLQQETLLSSSNVTVIEQSSALLECMLTKEEDQQSCSMMELSESSATCSVTGVEEEEEEEGHACYYDNQDVTTNSLDDSATIVSHEQIQERFPQIPFPILSSPSSCGDSDDDEEEEQVESTAVPKMEVSSARLSSVGMIAPIGATNRQQEFLSFVLPTTLVPGNKGHGSRRDKFRFETSGMCSAESNLTSSSPSSFSGYALSAPSSPSPPCYYSIPSCTAPASFNRRAVVSPLVYSDASATASYRDVRGDNFSRYDYDDRHHNRRPQFNHSSKTGVFPASGWELNKATAFHPSSLQGRYRVQDQSRYCDAAMNVRSSFAKSLASLIQVEQDGVSDRSSPTAVSTLTMTMMNVDAPSSSSSSEPTLSHLSLSHVDGDDECPKQANIQIKIEQQECDDGIPRPLTCMKTRRRQKVQQQQKKKKSPSRPYRQKLSAKPRSTLGVYTYRVAPPRLAGKRDVDEAFVPTQLQMSSSHAPQPSASLSVVTGNGGGGGKRRSDTNKFCLKLFRSRLGVNVIFGVAPVVRKDESVSLTSPLVKDAIYKALCETLDVRQTERGGEGNLFGERRKRNNLAWSPKNASAKTPNVNFMTYSLAYSIDASSFELIEPSDNARDHDFRKYSHHVPCPSTASEDCFWYRDDKIGGGATTTPTPFGESAYTAVDYICFRFSLKKKFHDDDDDEEDSLLTRGQFLDIVGDRLLLLASPVICGESNVREH